MTPWSHCFCSFVEVRFGSVFVVGFYRLRGKGTCHDCCLPKFKKWLVFRPLVDPARMKSFIFSIRRGLRRHERDTRGKKSDVGGSFSFFMSRMRMRFAIDFGPHNLPWVNGRLPMSEWTEEVKSWQVHKQDRLWSFGCLFALTRDCKDEVHVVLTLSLSSRFWEACTWVYERGSHCEKWDVQQNFVHPVIMKRKTAHFHPILKEWQKRRTWQQRYGIRSNGFFQFFPSKRGLQPESKSRL